MFVARFFRLPRTCFSLSNAHGIHFSRGSVSVINPSFSAISFPTIQFKLSDIGEGIAEVQIKEWYVKVGDKISQFDNLCEVQSDKAAVTITSRYDGVIKKLLFNVDDMAQVGQPLVEIDVEDGSKGDKVSSQLKKCIRDLYVKVGDMVSEFDSLCEVQSDKAAVTITSRYEGIIKKLLHKVDEVVRVGEPLVEIEVAGMVSNTDAVSQHQTEPSKLLQPSVVATTSESLGHIASGKVLATPAVRRVAMENKVDLKKVKGSGKDGRVLKEDVLKFLGQVKEGNFSTFIELSPLSEDRVVPLRGYTRTMIKTMSEALKIPHFGYDDEVHADALMKIRNELQEFGKERGIKFSFMPFFIKAASLALTEFPSINASIDDKFENIIYKASHNICLAMDTPGGLVVPNIKHCEQRSIFEIASELNRLHEDGKREKIAREDLMDGTFTISNIGSIGGTYASPVIFPPQVAIVALGRIQKLPRYDSNDNLVPMHIFKVSWAADHRVVDGATIARFSNRWKYYLEHPSAMLTLLK
uniref:Dihydrolipoamide acetyltransferase component of pyruvate dehydrogenase complex n=1 Tax=Angiostrongylus cantonensis TaxID=6313 RepID=A0A158PA61_ANGCA